MRPQDSCRARQTSKTRPLLSEWPFGAKRRGRWRSEVLDASAFYAEAGGQVGDLGRLTSESGALLLDVKVVQVFGGYVLHVGPLPEELRVGDEIFCEVDYQHRSKVAPNHTMTHVLNWALREAGGLAS